MNPIADHPTVAPGQLWQDEYGHVRVLAVAEGYAMLAAAPSRTGGNGESAAS